MTGSRVAGFVAIALLSAQGVAVGDCPTNRLSITFSGTYETNVTWFDSTVYRPDCDGRVAYDLRTGGVLAAAGAGFNYCGQSYVEVSDDFRLERLSSTAPTDFQLVLRVHYNGHIGSGYAFGAAEVREGIRSARVEYGYVESADTLLRLSLRRSEGEVFRLAFRLDASAAEGRVEMRVRYEFTGLPLGTRVRSCKGFGGHGPGSTRARSVSWCRAPGSSLTIQSSEFPGWNTRRGPAETSSLPRDCGCRLWSTAGYGWQ